MNISTISNSPYLNNVNNSIQNPDTRVAKTQTMQKPDAMTSATKTAGGDHYFEAKV